MLYFVVFNIRVVRAKGTYSTFRVFRGGHRGESVPEETFYIVSGTGAQVCGRRRGTKKCSVRKKFCSCFSQEVYH